MKNVKSLLAVATVLSLFLNIGSATPVVTESFDYPLGTFDPPLNGGIGWNGAWAPGWAGSSVVAPLSAIPNLDGVALSYTGNAASGTQYGGFSRELATPLVQVDNNPIETKYFSFLFKMTALPSADVKFGFLNQFNTVPLARVDSSGVVKLHPDDPSSPTFNATVGTTYFFAGEIKPYTNIYNGLSLGVNLNVYSGADIIEASAPATFSYFVDYAGTEIKKFNVAGPSETVVVDEIRIGTEWSDVAVPLSSLVITTTSPMPGGTTGLPYSQTLLQSNGTAPLTWSLDAGALPDDLTLSSSGVISGTPSGTGTSTFTVRLTDDTAATVTKELSITIDPPVLPEITTTSLPPGGIGFAYSQTLAASGGAGTLTWTIDSGSLPDDLTLSTGGVISGTPSATGTSTFTVRVTDGLLASDTQALSITINNIIVNFDAATDYLVSEDSTRFADFNDGYQLRYDFDTVTPSFATTPFYSGYNAMNYDFTGNTQGAPSLGMVDNIFRVDPTTSLSNFPGVYKIFENSGGADVFLLDTITVWKKENFLSGGDVSTVSFDSSSTLSVKLQGSWNLSAWFLPPTAAHFVVRNGSQYYISEQAFTPVLNGDVFSLGDFDNNSTVGKRWAVYAPTSTDFAFPASPTYEAVDFTDVTEVGFFVSTSGGFLRSYGFNNFVVTGVVGGGPPPLTGFAAWAEANGLPTDGSGLGAPDATPANDGIENFLKYALGIDAFTPGYQGNFTDGTVTDSGSEYLSLTYTFPEPAPDGVTYIPETCTDFTDWSGTNVVEVSNTVSGGFRTITVRDHIAIGVDPRRFMQLRVTSVE